MNDTLLIYVVTRKKGIQREKESMFAYLLSRSALSNIEKGRHWMNIEALWKLTQALGCKIVIVSDEMAC